MSNLNNKSSVSMKKATWRIFKKNGVVVNSMAAATIALMATSSFADPLPTGGTYVSGTGTIGSSGNTMNINQSTTNGIINWGSFSIGVGNTVNINNGDGATMNRVIGSDPSAIYGQLNATGSAYLINQNGIVIGPSGQVNTGGNFVASTRDISDDDFNDGGSTTYTGTSSAGVVNEGIIGAEGDVILVGKYVNNVHGAPYNEIYAGGDVLIGAGDVLLTENNGSGNRLAVLAGNGTIENSGTISAVNAELKANGGNIYALAINNSGIVKARGLQNVGGRIVLKSNDDITNSGLLQAGNRYINSEGIVEITGKNINLENNSRIDTSKNGRVTINAANGNWRNGEGVVNYNGRVDIYSDNITVNSGKTATGGRTDMLQNVKLHSTPDYTCPECGYNKFGTVSLNGFEDVNLNVVINLPRDIAIGRANPAGAELAATSAWNPTFGAEDENNNLCTTGSVVINAKNITVDEDMKIGGDFVLNAAAFDDATNDFVPEAGKGPNTLFSDGWKKNHGKLTFAGTSKYTYFTGWSPVTRTELSVCCGLTLTSGLDENGNRVDLSTDNLKFSYNITDNHTTNDYKWFEAKGFDEFRAEFEGGKLAVNDSNNPANNGFIKLINNYNFVDFDAEATNDILFVSFYDTFIDNVDVHAGKDLTIAVDEINPTTAGEGKLVVAEGADLRGRTIGLYTSKQGLNDIQGTLNGQSFAKGTEFTNTDIEKWFVFFSNRGTDLNRDPFKVYYKNQAIVTGGSDCSINPNQSGCENFASFSEQNKEYRVALAQDSTAPEEGALAWGNSSQVRANEFYTIKAYDYVDTNLTTSEKLTTFWYALPIQLVNIPLDGVAQVPGIQAIAEGIKGLTNGVESGLNSVVR